MCIATQVAFRTIHQSLESKKRAMEGTKMAKPLDAINSCNELLENVFNELPPDYVDQLKDVKSFRKVFTTNAKIIFKKDFISSLRFNTLTRIPERLYNGKYRSLRSADDVYFNVLLINNLERIGLNRTISIDRKSTRLNSSHS